MNTEIIENKKLNRRFFNEVSDFMQWDQASVCSEIAKDNAILFQIWVRKYWSISKGKYRHRGDFCRNDRLINEQELYPIFVEWYNNKSNTNK